MRLDTAQERIAEGLASELIEDDRDVDDSLLSNDIQHDLEAAAIEFSWTGCGPLIVRGLDRGRFLRTHTSDFDR